MGRTAPASDRRPVMVVGAVLAIVRDLYAHHGVSLPTRLLHSEAQDRFGIRPDAVNRALRELTDTDLVWKPERGYYEPTFREARDDRR